MPCIDVVCAASLSSASSTLPLIQSQNQRFSGGFTERATPVPIPNTAVKPLRADDTAWATAWESRTPPDPFSTTAKRPPFPGRAFRVSAPRLVPGPAPVRSPGDAALCRGPSPASVPLVPAQQVAPDAGTLRWREEALSARHGPLDVTA